MCSNNRDVFNYQTCDAYISPANKNMYVFRVPAIPVITHMHALFHSLYVHSSLWLFILIDVNRAMQHVCNMATRCTAMKMQ